MPMTSGLPSAGKPLPFPRPEAHHSRPQPQAWLRSVIASSYVHLNLAGPTPLDPIRPVEVRPRRDPAHRGRVSQLPRTERKRCSQKAVPMRSAISSESPITLLARAYIPGARDAAIPPDSPPSSGNDREGILDG